MSRSSRLALAALTLFFVVLPLTLPRPGLPMTLKADEPAYFLMALSLARDGDLRLEVRDVDRLFDEFPFRPARNLVLMSDDGWRTVYYGKPFVYPLLAAPFAGAFGAGGMVALNLLLLMAMVWMGFDYLRRFNGEGTAALFAAGFFLPSLGFVYAFWLQPEVFNMAALAAVLYLGLAPRRPGMPAGAEGVAGPWRAALSGASLALAAYNKPMIAGVALALLYAPLRRRSWGSAAAFVLGLAAALGAVAGLATLLTGHPTPYLGVERQGVVVCEPGMLPVEPAPVVAGQAASGLTAERPTGGAWSWIFRVPEVAWGELAENLGYFLWGRHTGLLLYMPFAALALVLFLLGRHRRSGRRWLLVASLAGIALFFLVFISHNWQGGGGFVGNRYFVNLYPAFLFLVADVRPRWLTAVGYGAASLFLGSILLSPFGRSEPEPTLQAHVRGAPFRPFPLELSLREVPGYADAEVAGYRWTGRRDVFLPQGDTFWLRGGSPVEITVQGGAPLDEPVFQVRNVTPGQRLDLALGGARERLRFGHVPPDGEVRRVTLSPQGPDRVLERGGEPRYVHRLLVHPRSGRIRHWTRHPPPATCAYFGEEIPYEEAFFLGAELVFLGPRAALEGDPFGVAWRRVMPPERVAAGSRFEVPVRLVNASGESWRNLGAARVQLAYHWLDAEGDLVLWEGRRTPLPLPVEPGTVVPVRQQVEAPGETGRYVLELDLVYEHVGWFSQRGQPTHRVEVEVVPGPGRAAGP